MRYIFSIEMFNKIDMPIMVMLLYTLKDKRKKEKIQVLRNFYL